MKTFFGTKTNMTQAWTKSGKRIPVTIVDVAPLTVAQVKTVEVDGYQAIKVDVQTKKTQKCQKEILVDNTETIKVGDNISFDQVVTVGDIVQVTGTTKGRGFSGVMKRWGFKGGPKTHGQSDRWRAPGSIGQGTTPGRVHKGKKMAGRYGNETNTVRNLQVVKFDQQNNQVWLSGPIPGANQGLVAINVIKEAKFEGLLQDEKGDDAAQTATE